MTDKKVRFSKTQLANLTEAQKLLLDSVTASHISNNAPAWFSASSTTIDSIRMATSFRRRLHEKLRRSLEDEEFLVDNGQRFVLLPISTAHELVGFLSDSNVLRTAPLDKQEQLKL